ncbi:MAG: LuxR C-terminal-related transcriptional regulator [Chloroflexales bacterium]
MGDDRERANVILVGHGDLFRPGAGPARSEGSGASIPACCGACKADIAARLHLSEGTVRNHVSAVLAKLEVADRTQAAVIAMHHGLGDTYP